MTFTPPVGRRLDAALAVGTALLLLFIATHLFVDALPEVWAASSPRVYATSFPGEENPISENGNWISGKSIGLDWSDVATTPGLASGTQSGAIGQGQSIALVTGVWTSDQIIEAKVHSVNGSDSFYEEVGLIVRGSLSAHKATGYEIRFRCSRSGAAYARLVRWNGAVGNLTVLKSANGSQYGVSEGDVVKATVIGNVITAYVNGKQLLQAVDNTFKSGNPGVSFTLQGTGGSSADYGFVSVTASENSQPASTSSSSLATAAASSTTWKYSTNFPLTENPISESGNWINGQAAGIDWANVRTTTGLAFGTETGDVNYDDSTALLTGTWGPDQTVQATVHTVNQNDNVWEEVEIRLRSSISAHVNTGYEINFRCSKTSNAYAQIVRWNGALGNFTFLQTKNGAAYGVANGDVVKASIVGNVITAWLNGTQILQATDNTFSSGKPGMGFYLKGHAPVSDYGFTNFMATDGSVSSSPTAPTNLMATPH